MRGIERRRVATLPVVVIYLVQLMLLLPHFPIYVSESEQNNPPHFRAFLFPVRQFSTHRTARKHYEWRRFCFVFSLRDQWISMNFRAFATTQVGERRRVQTQRHPATD